MRRIRTSMRQERLAHLARVATEQPRPATVMTTSAQAAAAIVCAFGIGPKDEIRIMDAAEALATMFRVKPDRATEWVLDAIAKL